MTIKKKIVGTGCLLLLAFALIVGAMSYLEHSLQVTLDDYRDKTDQLQGMLYLNTSIAGLMEASNYAIVQTMLGEDTDVIAAGMDAAIGAHETVLTGVRLTGEERDRVATLTGEMDRHVASVHELIMAGDSYGAGEDLDAIKAVSRELFTISDAKKQTMVAEYESALGRQARNRVAVLGLVALVVLALGVLWIMTTRSILKVNAEFSSRLAASSDVVSSVSAQVSEFSRSSADSASTQAASIQETSASLEMISDMTSRNAESARRVDQLMGDATRVIDRANTTMADLTGAMAEIYEASEDTSKIVGTIDEIAFQTNLLALNAAVEAARAGDAGKGFAVVAEEVRNLAQRAAEAAQSTTGLIEQTVAKVNGGRELVSTTNEAFSEVATSTAQVGDLVSEIAEMSSRQAEGIEQVNGAVGNMDQVVQKNAASAEESAAVSGDMTSQADKMKNDVNEFISILGV